MNQSGAGLFEKLSAGDRDHRCTSAPPSEFPVYTNRNDGVAPFLVESHLSHRRLPVIECDEKRTIGIPQFAREPNVMFFR